MSALPSLDSATLLLSVAVLSGVLAALSFVLAREVPEHRGELQWWSAAMLSSGLAFALFFLRGSAPDWLTFLASNLATLAIAAFGALAHARFSGSDPRPGTLTAMTLAGWAGPLATFFLHAPMGLAVASMSIAVAFISLSVAGGVWRAYRAAPSAGRLLSFAAFVTLGVVLAVRFAFVAFGRQALPMHSNAPMQLVVLLVGSVFVVCGTLGMLLMVVERQRQQVVESARRDGLTGVLNRTAFTQSAHALLQAKRPVALLMLDLDFFKRINDRHGHAAGDLVLVHAARMIAGACRPTDLVGRYGGEEFCVLLVDCREQEADEFAGRIVRGACASSTRLADAQVSWTLSVGHATSEASAAVGRAPSATLEQLFAQADRALYAAKAAGRNQWFAARALPRGNERDDAQATGPLLAREARLRSAGPA